MEEVIALTESGGHKLRRLRSDNAKEFVSEAMKNICRQHNIVHEYTTSYCPEQNGRVEHQNRTIIEMARSMLASGNLSKSLWGEAVRTAAHIRNRVPLARLNEKTPIEVWSGEKPDVSHLRIFGSRIYIDKTQRKKLDNKSQEMVLVGYMSGQKAYRLWERGTRRIIVSRDVIIVESLPNQIVGLPEPIGIEDMKADEEPQCKKEDETSRNSMQINTFTNQWELVKKNNRINQQMIRLPIEQGARQDLLWLQWLKHYSPKKYLKLWKRSKSHLMPKNGKQQWKKK